MLLRNKSYWVKSALNVVQEQIWLKRISRWCCSETNLIESDQAPNVVPEQIWLNRINDWCCSGTKIMDSNQVSNVVPERIWLNRISHWCCFWTKIIESNLALMLFRNRYDWIESNIVVVRNKHYWIESGTNVVPEQIWLKRISRWWCSGTKIIESNQLLLLFGTDLIESNQRLMLFRNKNYWIESG
jgi:hypothetical protein